VSCEDAAGIRNMIALDPDPQTPAQVATVVRTVKAF